MKKSSLLKGNPIKRKLKSAVYKAFKEKKLIDLNRTYVIFGKNNVYRDICEKNNSK